MKSTGIVRCIDNLGRIVLPKELRTSMKLETDSKLEIFVEGDQIILKSTAPRGAATSAAKWTPMPCSLRVTASARSAAKDRSPVTKERLYEPDDRPDTALYGAGADASCVPLRAGGGSARYFAAFTRDGGIH